MAFLSKYRDFALAFWSALVGALVFGLISYKTKKSEKYTLHHLPNRKKRKKIVMRGN